jgi:murein DD-endopeptidase MepM/ murein hydrolase activator NlpD
LKRRFGSGLAALLLVATAPAPIALAQGDIHRGHLPAGARDLTLDGVPVPVTPAGEYLIGVGRDAGPQALLAWTAADGSAVAQPIAISPRQWRIQSLPTLPPRPVPDAEFEARRPGEVARIAAARAVVSEQTGWRGDFARPAPGPVTGVFGSQRILAGTPSAPHAGLDFGAPPGTPVVAPAPGVVTLADGPFTLEGNLVILDHGQGLMSSFLHLSRIDVRPGDVVAAGQRLGAVGRSGRATGPHLHWGVTWRHVENDVRVDPARLLAATAPEPR